MSLENIEPMIINLLIFTVIIAFFIAQVEIQIEGSAGWARNLPTWKIKNRLTSFLFGKNPLTGYHLWFALMGIVFLQFPFFVGVPFSLSLELKILAVFFWGIAIEDFFWFLLNPAFGLKKFNKNHVIWHDWVGFIPRFYLIYFAIGLALLLLSSYF